MQPARFGGLHLNHSVDGRDQDDIVDLRFCDAYLRAGPFDTQKRDEGCLAAAGILAGALADFLGRALDIEQIVSDLKG